MDLFEHFTERLAQAEAMLQHAKQAPPSPIREWWIAYYRTQVLQIVSFLNNDERWDYEAWEVGREDVAT